MLSRHPNKVSMKNENGFTLIEVLLILCVLAVLVLLSAPINLNVLDNKEEEQFLATFESDLLYIQSVSYLSNENIRMQIKVDKYTINDGYLGNVIYSRSIPNGWSFDLRTIQSGVISFNQNGTIRESGTIYLNTDKSTFKIVFALGKGRCYIEKL